MENPIEIAKMPTKPEEGMEIVWRFKDNKGWRVGRVREVMADGRVIRIHDNEFVSLVGDTVALRDIDWYMK